MKGCEGYGALAHVYDKLNAEIDYGAWADFVEACFDRFLPARPHLVLDLACGTGSMALALACRGYDMIGVDGSADMLSEAFSRSAEQGINILWLEQDMRAFELYGTVGAVTCCLDSVNYLLSDKDLADCFACVHNYLDPDGIFLFDMNTPYKFETIYGNNAYILEDELVYADEAGEERIPVFCGWQNTYHAESGLCDFDLSIFEELPDGTYRRADEHQTERCYTLDAVRNTLERAGFTLLGAWSDYQFSSPDARTERWYFAARAIKP
ncbi:MAG: class I SAM-dependent methyltransferase [Clostridia bacterium]|nr:class I SAM-dependent methyltransferase [Clostridia bacterium]